MKTCTKCKAIKPLDMFSNRSKGKNNFRPSKDPKNLLARHVMRSTQEHSAHEIPVIEDQEKTLNIQKKTVSSYLQFALDLKSV